MFVGLYLFLLNYLHDFVKSFLCSDIFICKVVVGCVERTVTIPGLVRNGSEQ